MSVTQKWLDQAKKAQRFTSDYQLAKAAGVSTQRLGNYRGDSNRGMDGDLAIKIAELAGVAPGVVLAELSAEKSKSDAERGAWLKVAAQMGRAAALCVILSVGMMALKPSPAMASSGSGVVPIYTLCAYMGKQEELHIRANRQVDLPCPSRHTDKRDDAAHHVYQQVRGRLAYQVVIMVTT